MPPIHIVDSKPSAPALPFMREHVVEAAEHFDKAAAQCILCERASYQRCGIFKPHKPADYGGSSWFDRFIIYPICYPCSLLPTKDTLDKKLRAEIEVRRKKG